VGKLGTFTAAQVLTAAELNTGAGAAASYSPTYANLTIGNGVVTAKYNNFGRTYFFKWRLTLGTTSAVGSGPIISLPQVMADSIEAYSFIGVAIDGATGYYPLKCIPSTSASVGLNVFNASATYTTETGMTSTIPVALGNADAIILCGTYEGTS
jgi:hypothetical protein